ncbi:MAG: DUF222 domain-containing protein [Actinobacteria bacterium]|nr:DUF222 domain-containing protein [Actinomycetota bacterium]
MLDDGIPVNNRPGVDSLSSLKSSMSMPDTLAQYMPIEVPSGAPTELKDLVRAAEAAADVDLSLLSGDALNSMTEMFDRLRSSVDAIDSSHIEALDESMIWSTLGHANIKAMLRSRTNLPGPDVGRRTACAYKLKRMPDARTAFEAGLISIHHVRLLGECLARRYDGAFVEWEPRLVTWAIEFDWDSFAKAIARWKDAADTSEPDERDASDAAARSLHVSKSIGGRGILSGTLTPVQYEAFANVLDPIVDQLFKDEWADAEAEFGKGKFTVDNLVRDPAQRRVDALEIMAQRAHAALSRRAPAPIVHVHIGIADLGYALKLAAGLPGKAPEPEDALCELGNGTPISYTKAVELLIDAHIQRVVFDADGEVLDLGQKTRFFTPVQKTALVCRDRYCRCGCGRPARRCQADHIIEWHPDGPTDVANGQMLCPKTNRLKSHSGAPTRLPQWWERGPAGPRLRRKGRGRPPNPSSDPDA